MHYSDNCKEQNKTQKIFHCMYFIFIAEGLYNYSCYLSPSPRPAAKDQFKSRKRNTGFS